MLPPSILLALVPRFPHPGGPWSPAGSPPRFATSGNATWTSAGVRYAAYPSLKLTWHEAHTWCSTRGLHSGGHLVSIPNAETHTALATPLTPMLGFGLQANIADWNTMSFAFTWYDNGTYGIGNGTAPAKSDPRLPAANTWPYLYNCGVWHTGNNTWGQTLCSSSNFEDGSVTWPVSALSAAVSRGGVLCAAPDVSAASPPASPPLLPYTLSFRGTELLLFPYGAQYGTNDTANWPGAYSTALATCAAYGAEVLRLPAGLAAVSAPLPSTAGAAVDGGGEGRSEVPLAAASAAVGPGTAAGAASEAAALMAALSAAVQQLPLGASMSQKGILAVLKVRPGACVSRPASVTGLALQATHGAGAVK